jgi:DNA-binding MarR family transcriptional regulator
MDRSLRTGKLRTGKRPHLHQHPHQDQHQDQHQHRHQHQPLTQTWRQIYSPQSHINYWLKLVETRFYAKFSRELRLQDIIPSEWAALRELYRPTPLSPLDVGRAIGMSKGGASKLIDRLVKKGLVTKKVGEFDRRHRAVSLTQYGRTIVPLLAYAEQLLHGEFFRLLPLEERERLMEALQKTLGAEQINYMDQWISTEGRGGQWVFQAAWHGSVRRRPCGLSRSDVAWIARATGASGETP